MQNNTHQINLSNEIFDDFLKELEGDCEISADVVSRLSDVLLNDNMINENNIKSAIFPEDI